MSLTRLGKVYDYGGSGDASTQRALASLHTFVIDVRLWGDVRRLPRSVYDMLAV